MVQTRNLLACRLAVLIAVVVSAPQSTSAQDAVGRWKGSWSSTDSGHRGALRATIRPTADGNYQARFVGRFAAVIPFAYRADLKPMVGCPGQYTSSKRLPLLGEYRMTANVVGDSFYATFRGGRDVGIFTMTRR